MRGRAELLPALLDGYGFSAAARSPSLREQFFTCCLLHRFAELRRDVNRLSDAPPATLDLVARALWPLP